MGKHYKWPFSIAMLVYQRVGVFFVVSFLSGMITELLQNLISKTHQARYPLIGRVGKYG